jgi:hypothetical protein
MEPSEIIVGPFGKVVNKYSTSSDPGASSCWYLLFISVRLAILFSKEINPPSTKIVLPGDVRSHRRGKEWRNACHFIRPTGKLQRNPR